MKKLAIVTGSHRPQSESQRIGEYLAKRCSELSGAEVYQLHLGEHALPLWDAEFEQLSGKWTVWPQIQTELIASEAFIFITPEWGGMATPAIKNFFLFCTHGELAHKPGMLVATSSGRGGAFPIAELRGMSSKNTQICYIPEHLIVRQSAKLFKASEQESALEKDDVYMRSRVDGAIQTLVAYADALTRMRTEQSAQLKARYLYGMS